LSNDLKKPTWILYAEDDDDDYLLVCDTFKEAGFTGALTRVKDGQELMTVLSDGKAWPSLILLDLNMPKKDGREALKEIKSHSRLRRIPVIVLTTSRAAEDVFFCYEAGANSFVRKPIHFDMFVNIARLINEYWLETSILPDH
jgi:two-component system response regulator